MRQRFTHNKLKLATVVATTAIALLSGCVKPNFVSDAPISITPTTWNAQQAKLEKIDHFELNGIIGLQTPKKSVTANLHWKQEGPSQYSFDIIGPVGMGGVKINKKNEITTLVSDKQHQLVGSSASQLIYENTGIMVPIENLFYWIRGLPAPGSITNKTLNSEMVLSELKQDNWLIEYLRYDNQPNLKLKLPAKILISNEQFRVKIVINRWL